MLTLNKRPGIDYTSPLQHNSALLGSYANWLCLVASLGLTHILFCSRFYYYLRHTWEVSSLHIGQTPYGGAMPLTSVGRGIMSLFLSLGTKLLFTQPHASFSRCCQGSLVSSRGPESNEQREEICSTAGSQQVSESGRGWLHWVREA